MAWRPVQDDPVFGLQTLSHAEGQSSAPAPASQLPARRGAGQSRPQASLAVPTAAAPGAQDPLLVRHRPLNRMLPIRFLEVLDAS